MGGQKKPLGGGYSQGANAFCNASAFHFIKHITHIAWASFPVIGAGIICVFKSVVIRHDAQQLKRFLHMRQIL